MSNPKTLLFVDDEEEILEILVDLFSDEGYSIKTAKNTGEALQIIGDIPVGFIMSDTKLRDILGGKELLGKAHKINPNMIRVLTSGYLDVKFGQVVQDDQEKNLFYIAKPWDLLMLREFIKNKVGK